MGSLGESRDGAAGGGGAVRPRVVVITGPTAVGKSAAAERIALKSPAGAELISADSVQVYTGLDIGSAKPSLAEQAAVKYHLLDIVAPTEEYSAADFARAAHAAITDIDARGKLPVVVGGTGFYIQWLVFGSPGAPAPTPEATRKADAEVVGFAADWDAAILRATQLDPEYAKCIERNDWFRLKRMFEVWHTAGQPMSSYDRPQGKKASPADVPALLRSADVDFRCFFLHRPRLQIFRDIDLRCEKMLQAGFIEEVAGLVHAGALRMHSSGTSVPQKREVALTIDSPEKEQPGERAIGYRQVLDMFAAAIRAEEDLLRKHPERAAILEAEGGLLPEDVADEMLLAFVKDFQAVSRQFVKRQLTWFRGDPTFRWVSASDPAAAVAEIEQEAGLDQDTFLAQFLDPDACQAQAAIRNAEQGKEEQQALKRYLPTIQLFASKESRAPLRAKLNVFLQEHRRRKEA